ncbi:uncharacterized protein LOC136082948 [Hydra vulgaris]|uniref:Uncharacterized protein LOC136082948 n=1 Tax=Hydra vulgaris TaxID=6087 RepID=A0ABM4C9V1_HYDVU
MDLEVKKKKKKKKKRVRAKPKIRWWKLKDEDCCVKFKDEQDEEIRQKYKEMCGKTKRAVAKAKEKAYSNLYEKLNTKEGEKDLYRLARQRNRDGEESVLGRWKKYFEELMNQENDREGRLQETEIVNQEVPQVTKEKVRAAIRRMKCGKAVGPDDIPVETWKCLGEIAVEFLTGLFNRILEGQKMPEEWRHSIMVPIFKNKGDVQSYSNYRGIKLISYSLKIWERVVEARLRGKVETCEQQYGFMPAKCTTDAMFALRVLNGEV